MYTARPRVRGMGDAVSSATGGIFGVPGMTEIQKCSSGMLTYLTNPDCWGYSPSAWQEQRFGTQQAANLQPPPAPQPVTNYGVSETVPPTPEQAQAAINASLTKAAQAAEAQNLQSFQNMSPIPDMSSSFSLSDLLASLMPGGGGTPSTGLSTKTLIAIGLVAGGGILILTSMGGRRRRR